MGKFVQLSVNKIKCPLDCGKTPVLSGATSKPFLRSKSAYKFHMYHIVKSLQRREPKFRTATTIAQFITKMWETLNKTDELLTSVNELAHTIHHTINGALHEININVASEKLNMNFMSWLLQTNVVNGGVGPLIKWARTLTHSHTASLSRTRYRAVHAAQLGSKFHNMFQVNASSQKEILNI